jgi:hypothetical protein
VNNVWKKIDETITIKEIDKKRKPYSVMNTLSLCLKNSVASVLRPDPRFDDTLLCVDEACQEPLPAIIDNCKGDAIVNKVVKQVPEVVISPIINEPQPSRASSPMGSTRKR